jgi:FKBP-type peptidyl-prolyl cis-trans isomerase
MKKSSSALTSLIIAGLLAAPSTFAQQSAAPAAGTQAAAPAAKSGSQGAASAPAAKGVQAPGTKTGQATGAKKPATAAAPLTTDKQKASYAIGENIGKSLKRDDVDLDTATFMRGLRDAFSGAKPALTDDEAKAVLTKLATDVRAKQQAKLEAQSASNKKESDAFLAANKTKEGVTALSSGLQYKVLTAGDGPKPTSSDKVVCNYRGTLLDGTEFDSSYKRGQPATFPVTGVIKGWTEALQLMPVGSKWQLFVPPDMAYGLQGRPGIPPNSALVFEVELLSIAPKPEAAKPTDAAKPTEAKPADDGKPNSN